MPDLPDDHLTEHFTRAELACHDGCGLIPGPKFLSHLELLRAAYGRPMRITSCARCATHNGVVANTGPNGPHVVTPDRALNGEGAVDVGVYGADAVDLIRIALQLNTWHGVGVYQDPDTPLHQRFIHLDCVWNTPNLPRPRVWSGKPRT